MLYWRNFHANHSGHGQENHHAALELQGEAGGNQQADCRRERRSPKTENLYRLYRELGSYAAVGRKMGRSGSTVARYIKMRDCPALVRHTTKELMRKG